MVWFKFLKSCHTCYIQAPGIQQPELPPTPSTPVQAVPVVPAVSPPVTKPETPKQPKKEKTPEPEWTEEEKKAFIAGLKPYTPTLESARKGPITITDITSEENTVTFKEYNKEAFSGGETLVAEHSGDQPKGKSLVKGTTHKKDTAGSAVVPASQGLDTTKETVKSDAPELTIEKDTCADVPNSKLNESHSTSDQSDRKQTKTDIIPDKLNKSSIQDVSNAVSVSNNDSNKKGQADVIKPESAAAGVNKDKPQPTKSQSNELSKPGTGSFDKPDISTKTAAIVKEPGLSSLPAEKQEETF